MSRITRYTAVGLASFGLLGGSLIATAPAYADHRGDRSRSDYKEVEGKDCLKSDHDRECKSKTWLDVDEWKFRGKSGWRAVKLSADVDFFQKKSDDHRKDDWNKRDGDQSWNNRTTPTRATTTRTGTRTTTAGRTATATTTMTSAR